VKRGAPNPTGRITGKTPVALVVRGGSVTRIVQKRVERLVLIGGVATARLRSCPG